MLPRPPRPTLFPYTTLFRSLICEKLEEVMDREKGLCANVDLYAAPVFWMLGFKPELNTSIQKTGDRKSTRLNSSHTVISYAVFCLKKKKTPKPTRQRAQHIR